jgi:hypothetical protein
LNSNEFAIRKKGLKIKREFLYSKIILGQNLEPACSPFAWQGPALLASLPSLSSALPALAHLTIIVPVVSRKRPSSTEALP